LAPVNVPDDRRYTSDHEWALSTTHGVRVGITDFAQDALGDVVFISLPAVGAVVERGGPLGEVESTKSVSDVYAPVAGTVLDVNVGLGDAPGQLNSDPYGEGWLCLISSADDSDLQSLLDPDAYRKLISE